MLPPVLVIFVMPKLLSMTPSSSTSEPLVLVTLTSVPPLLVELAVVKNCDVLAAVTWGMGMTNPGVGSIAVISGRSSLAFESLVIWTEDSELSNKKLVLPLIAEVVAPDCAQAHGPRVVTLDRIDDDVCLAGIEVEARASRLYKHLLLGADVRAARWLPGSSRRH